MNHKFHRRLLEQKPKHLKMKEYKELLKSLLIEPDIKREWVRRKDASGKEIEGWEAVYN